MRLLTKAEACRAMAVSLSTLDRRIASGELTVRREPHGSRHRVFLLLDDDPPQQEDDGASCASELAAARERVRGLEEQLVFLQSQLQLEQQRNAALASELRAQQEAVNASNGQRPWWRVW
ncbi:MAG: hypothetical protein OXN22_06835 [Deltaproteobacteria bacterium]|nr:hypothetical protein [Deltaproteobacteria bacterium]